MDCNPRGRLAAGPRPQLRRAFRPPPHQWTFRYYDELVRESLQEGPETMPWKLTVQNCPGAGRQLSIINPISRHQTQSPQNAIFTFCRILAICWSRVRRVGSPEAGRLPGFCSIRVPTGVSLLECDSVCAHGGSCGNNDVHNATLLLETS